MPTLTPLANLTDEELMARVYTAKPTCSDLEMELCQRLQHALDEMARPPTRTLVHYLNED